jgi:hypothetical protein
MITPDEHHALCAACRHNRMIPDISNPSIVHAGKKSKPELKKKYSGLNNFSAEINS